MKKIVTVIFALIMAMTVFTSCGKDINSGLEGSNTPEIEANTEANNTDPNNPDASAEPVLPIITYDFIEDNGIEYIWNQLDDNTKIVMAELMNCFQNYEVYCSLSTGFENTDEYRQELLQFIYNCAMDYTYIDTQFKCHDVDQDGIVDAVTIPYLINYPEEGEARTKALNDKLDEIIAGMPDGSQYEQIKYLHDYIILNTTYSADAVSPFTAFGCLVEQKATCNGYADAMHLLLARAGFETCFATGYGESDTLTHKWNYVHLDDGHWYVIDATWDDPQNKPDPNYITWDYFLISDDVLLSDHREKFKSNFYIAPVADSMDFCWHKQTGNYCETYDEAYAAATKQATECAKNGSRYIYLRMANDQVYQEVMNKFFESSEGYQFQYCLEAAKEATSADLITTRWSKVAKEGPRTITVTLKYESDEE